MSDEIARLTPVDQARADFIKARLRLTLAVEAACPGPHALVVEEEWAVRYSGRDTAIRSTGFGYWGRSHAEQEVERVKHNANLPNVGQPKSAEVLRRTVTRAYHATAWSPTNPPGLPADPQGCDA